MKRGLSGEHSRAELRTAGEQWERENAFRIADKHHIQRADVHLRELQLWPARERIIHSMNLMHVLQ